MSVTAHNADFSAFRALHENGLLRLPNAWDAGSVRFQGADLARVEVDEVARRGISLVPADRTARARALDDRALVRGLSAPARAASQPRRRLVGRRAADAVDRARWCRAPSCCWTSPPKAWRR
jgi:hypothetical protein